jgi:hypothetical protein
MRASVTASNRAWRSPKRPYRRVPAGRSPRPVLCCRRRPRGLVGPTRPAASRGVNRLRAPLLLRPKERPGSGQRHRARSNVRRVCTRRSAGAAGASLKVIGGIRATVLGSANRLAATKPFQLARLSARRRHRWHENSCTAPNRKKRASLALGYRLLQSRPGSQRRRSFRPLSKFWRAWSRHLAPAGAETLYRVNALAGSDRLAEPAAP